MAKFIKVSGELTFKGELDEILINVEHILFVIPNGYDKEKTDIVLINKESVTVNKNIDSVNEILNT